MSRTHRRPFRLAGLVAGLALTQSAVGQAHGIGISHVCDTPRIVGQTASCEIELVHNDGFGDTLAITDAYFVVNPSGPGTLITDVEIVDVSGNTTAIPGGSLPVLLGPPDSLLSGLPGHPDPGRVTIRQDLYVIQPGDPDPLGVQSNVEVFDLCDNPETQGCTSLPSLVQFFSDIDLVSPAISIVKTADVTSVCLGEPTDVTYFYLVTNPGDVDLEQVVVLDDTCSPPVFAGGDLDGDLELDTSETWTFICTDVIDTDTTNLAMVTASVVGLPSVQVEDEDSMTIVAHPPPMVSVANIEICEGAQLPLELCAFVSGGTPPYTYDWSTGDTTECIQVAAAGTYAVTVTDENGCTDAATGSLTIHPPPPCWIDGPHTLCASLTTEFSGPVEPELLYDWSIVGNATIVGPPSTPHVLVEAGAAGSFTLSLTVIDAATGCVEACDTHVIVAASPPCTISGPPTACEAGPPVMYEAPLGPYTYQWNITGAGAITGPDDAPEVTVTPGPSGWFDLLLSVTSFEGCYAECSANVQLIPCGEPGACCHPGGGCTETFAADCAHAGGAFQGEGTDCAGTSCPQPGACCLDDGTCIVQLGEPACAGAGGAWQGDDSECATVLCPQPGACCFADGTCRQENTIGGADCVNDGGTYYGDFTECGSVVCPDLCPEDLDDSGDVGFGDILEIIGAWGPCAPGPCPRDLSGNGVVDFADILAVIGAWGPCP
ncbi:MAG: hypothetical protein GY715_11075 [Planctomycetes bacterium]|nr:hypothetical protein [Planctomycetota bacterium]